MSELYEIEDPRPIAAASPYTFFLPDPALIAAVDIGDSVKAVFIASPLSEKYGAERMWVTITSTNGDWLEGTLDSQPYDMPKLTRGMTIRLPRSHVISVDLRDPAKVPRDQLRDCREYWDRCMVDQSVIDGDMKVRYLYRETPDLAGPKDKYPDSGWRMRGEINDFSNEELASREVAYVALGLVLNKDDAWIHLIDEPIGSAFEWYTETGEFVKRED